MHDIKLLNSALLYNTYTIQEKQEKPISHTHKHTYTFSSSKQWEIQTYRDSRIQITIREEQETTKTKHIFPEKNPRKIV
jgi:hypothetical protein